ncbi:TrmJ/YjtD family RNA methyltransferase [Candidatus Woesearchaeota archaeon]|nr:TrmJ/YjtD family RNA methyltransferase [Candidatus Woesearchaeota archaeon]
MIEVILTEPRKQENLGSVARIMKNFSFDRLVLIRPKCKFGKTAFKVAKHGKDIFKKVKIRDFSYLKKLDYLIGTTSKLGADYNLPRNALSAEQAALKLSKVNYKKLRVGILIGREGTGLKNEEISLCDILVTIPASRGYPTMNVSHACSIILYEIFKKISNEKSNSHINFATKKEKEIILGFIKKVLDKIDFSTKEKKDTQKKVWRRVIGKAMLTKREAFALMGFFRKLGRK